MPLSDFDSRVAAVEWQRYRQGQGSGSIPLLLTGLTSEDQAVREESVSELEWFLLPRNVLAEATYYAIPFLIEIISEKQSRAEAYGLLTLIGICAQPGSYDEEIRIGENLESLASACRRQLATGISFYLRDAQDASLPTALRSEALGALCRLPEARQAWLPLLQTGASTEKDPELRQQMAEWLQRNS
jgi:hypothetical protein